VCGTGLPVSRRPLREHGVRTSRPALASWARRAGQTTPCPRAQICTPSEAPSYPTRHGLASSKRGTKASATVRPRGRLRERHGVRGCRRAEVALTRADAGVAERTWRAHVPPAARGEVLQRDSPEGRRDDHLQDVAQHARRKTAGADGLHRHARGDQGPHGSGERTGHLVERDRDNVRQRSTKPTGARATSSGWTIPSSKKSSAPLARAAGS
jgi:hypothetical protein